MHFQNAFAVLGFLESFAIASPAANASPNKLETRGTATVSIFHGDGCTNQADSFTIYQGGYRCAPYSNARSISLSNSGCSVKTWSGGNCQGSSKGVGNGCNSILFGSVSIQC
ncbi:Methyltransferase OMS1 [Apiospora arundinis]